MERCKECKYLNFYQGNGNPSRYYCGHKDSGKAVGCGSRLISRCDRHSSVLKIKNAPRWCPLKTDVGGNSK